MANKRIVTDRIQKSMQADYDRGMSLADVARKYGVSYELARKHVNNNRLPILDEPKVGIVRPGFGCEWNAVRFALIMGLRTEWIDEWNAARLKLLALKE